MKPHLRLIQFIGLIVPRRLRADWRQEWEAELRYREALLAEWDKLHWQNKLDLLWRSTSAFWDAFSLAASKIGGYVDRHTAWIISLRAAPS